MNSTRSVLCAISGCLTFYSAHGQTLTNATNSPVLGDVISVNFAGVPTPIGPAGQDQTWNYSDLDSPFSSMLDVVASAITPSAASFPDATIAFVDDNFEYFKTNDAGLSFSGSQEPGDPNGLVYQDLEMLLSYPCVFNTSWTDAFAASYGSPVSMTRMGTVTGFADGFGTLIMPYGTVQNVLRVRTTEVYTDINVGLDTTEYDLTTYCFYKPGFHYQLLGIVSGTIGGSGIDQAYWSANYVDGISEALINNIGLQLSPNPATGHTTLVYTGTGSNMQLTVFNAVGCAVHNELLLGRTVGIVQHTLDIGSLAQGLYQVRITAMDGQQGTTRLVVN